MTGIKFNRRQALRLAGSGGIALASSAFVLSGPSVMSILAGAPLSSTVVVGILPTAYPAGDVPPDAAPFSVQMLDLTTLKVVKATVPSIDGRGQPVLRSNETIGALVALVAQGKLGLVVTPVAGGRHGSDPPRLVRLGTTDASTTSIAGLRADEQLTSLVNAPDGALVGLVGQRSGRPPFRVVSLDPITGAVANRPILTLASDRRYANLAYTPDGRLWATELANDGPGSTVLVQLASNGQPALRVTLHDLADRTGKPWNNGLASLVGSSNGQLLALGAMRYKSPKAVYSVDQTYGGMSKIKDFDVARLAFALG